MHLSSSVQFCILLALSTFSSHSPLVNAATPTCDAHMYGNPNLRDCIKALKKIPYATNRQDAQVVANHLFVEPQQMSIPFGSVRNIYRPKRILQLPKIWKHNSCRVVLMTLGLSSQPVAVRPVFTTSWKQIIVQSDQLRKCLLSNSPRGGYVGFEMRSTALAGALYLYTTGSLFEARMNAYMTDGVPVVPISLAEAWNTSDTNATMSFTGHGLDLLNSSFAGIETAATGQFRHVDTS